MCNKTSKTAVVLQVKHVDKKKPTCVKKQKKRLKRVKISLTFRKLEAERTQGGISREGGEREMVHDAVMPTERALNVFNIT